MGQRTLRNTGLLVWTGRVLTVALAARVLYLSIRYLNGVPGAFQYAVESAATIYVAFGLVTRVLSSTREPGDQQTRTRGILILSWPFWWAASVALYWPSLNVGLLSDDFILADRAVHWQIGPVHSELFRPVPLLVWGAILNAGGGATILHLLNVLCHGTVAWLTTRLAGAWTSSRMHIIAAGLVVLTFPASVEAVTWCAGVFDITATLLCAVCVLVSRRYSAHTGPSIRFAFVACAVLALFCKETAIVVPLLVLIDAWALRRWSRQFLLDSGILITSLALVGMLRFIAASPLVKRPITKYIVQRWIFGTTGGLLVPWHIDVLQQSLWIPIFGVIAVMVLSSVFFVTAGFPQQLRAVVAAALWMLIGTLPLVTILFIAPNLEAARYLYLPSIGFATLVATMIAPEQRRIPYGISMVAAIALIGLGGIGVRLHQRSWHLAAEMRDVVEREADRDSRIRDCSTVVLTELPDSVRGAYVFRNGADVALSGVGVVVSPSAASACTFRWNANRRAFDSAYAKR